MKKNMTSKIILAAVLGLSGSAFAQSNDQKLADLENRISELEASNSLNIFKFNGLLETRYDAIKATQDTPAGSSKFDGNVQYFRTRVGLGLDADVSKYIKFYSKLAMSKYHNVFGTQTVGAGATPVVNQDLYIAKDERGAQVYIEKAYADVNLFDSGFVFSFGRLPTSDGPPFHLQSGRPRMGTYPGLLYNAELDGLALTYNRQINSDQRFAFRIVNSPFTRRTDSTGKFGGTSIITNPTIGGNSGNTMIDLSTAMAEYTVSNLSFADNINVILQAWQVGKMPINGSEFNFGAGAGSGFAESKIGAQALHIDIENIAKSGFDLSYTIMQSKVENEGVITVPTGASSSTSLFGYGANAAGDSSTGTSSLISARYAFNNANFLGAEYLMGSKSTFVYDFNNDSLTNFYSTPGTGTHAYYIHKLMPELALKVGYMDQKYSGTPFGFGAASVDSDRKITTYYGSVRLDF